MRDSQLLANCLVENDSKDAAPAKLLRRESFVLSILIQGALVATLLIIPIFTPECNKPTIFVYTDAAVSRRHASGQHRSRVSANRTSRQTRF